MPVTSLARPSRAARWISPQPAVRPLSILIVDDGDRQGLVDLLRSTFGEETQIRESDSGLAALEILRRARVDVVLVDHLLPDMNGLELVSAVADMADDTAVILMSERGSGRMAAEAIKSGARDYLDRHELNGDALRDAIVAALRTAKLEWRTSRMLGRLRRDQAEVGQHVRGLAQDVQHSVSSLEESITELKQLCEEPPMRQLVDHFAQVQQSLRRSLAMLHKLSERSAEDQMA
jgi:DNA-binding NtrC family response regulator